MKAMAVVAHPDDCVIFAYSYIHNHPDYVWTICYLTYTDLDSRAVEFKDFWQKRGIKTIFLGQADVWNVELDCPGAIDQIKAAADIQAVIADQDLILTHNQQGEYGHPHHVFVHQTTSGHPRRVTFANFGQGNVQYSIEAGVYSLDEMPLHRDIVEQFHKDKHINEYTV